MGKKGMGSDLYFSIVVEYVEVGLRPESWVKLKSK